MATATKRMSIFRALFSSEIDVEDYENERLPKELEEVRKSIEAKEAKIQQGFNSSTKGGFAKKIDPKTEEAMRAMHSKVVKKESQEREERE